MTRSLVPLLALLFAASAHAEWPALQVSTTLDRPDPLVSADMDGDGDLDVLSGGSDCAVWWENDGTGVFPRMHVVSCGFDEVDDLDLADVDGDGDADVLVADGRGDRFAWVPRAGSGFGPPVDIASAVGPASISAADVDADGDLDALMTAWQEGVVLLAENTGAGFGSVFTVDGAAEYANHAVAADFDGDGDLDIAAAMGDGVFWYRTSAVGFGSPQLIEWGSAAHLDAADLNGDGRVDLAMAIDHAIRWFAGSGAGTFSAEPSVSETTMVAAWVGAEDLDADGDLDLIAGSFGDEDVATFANTGSGFGPERIVASGLASLAKVAAGDLDGDADLDLVVSRHRLGTRPHVDWVPQGPAGWLAARPVLGFGPYGPLAVTDADRDGVLDVVSAYDLAVYRGLGGGSFALPVLADPGAAARELLAVDVDGDGWEDLVQTDYTGVDAYVLSPSGLLERRIVTQAAAERLAVADVTGDGTVDLLLSGWDGSPGEILWLYPGSGASVGPGIEVGDSLLPPYLPGQIEAVRTGDLDGDGDLDIAYAVSFADYTYGGGGGYTYYGEIRWVENRGAAPPATWLVTNNVPIVAAMELADLDGDGLPDVLAGQSSPAQVRWYRGTGAGFVQQPPLDLTGVNITDIAAADLDGDGLLDVVSAGPLVGVQWNRNIGGSFGPRQVIATTWTDHFDLGDVDSDGDLDIAAYSHSGLVVLRND